MFKFLQKKTDCQPWLTGLLQATGVVSYILLVIAVMSPLMSRRFDEQVVGPLMVMLLFSTSALACGILVFYRPYTLFFLENKKAEAAQAVVWTAGWLCVYFLMVILSIFLFLIK